MPFNWDVLYLNLGWGRRSIGSSFSVTHARIPPVPRPGTATLTLDWLRLRGVSFLWMKSFFLTTLPLLREEGYLCRRKPVNTSLIPCRWCKQGRGIGYRRWKPRSDIWGKWQMPATKISERSLAFGPLCFATMRYVAHIYLSHVLVFYRLSPGTYPRVSHPG